MRGHSKRLICVGIFFVALMAALCLQAGAEPRKGKLVFGLQAGWGFGFAPEFGWRHFGKYLTRDRLDFDLGAYARVYVSDRFGLMLLIDYQHGTYKTKSSEEILDKWPFSIKSGSLLTVLDLVQNRRTCLYALAGAGGSSGSGTFDNKNMFVLLTGGAGLRVFLKEG